MLVSSNDFYCGNASGLPCQLALKNQIPSAYVHPSEKQCNYVYIHPTTKQCNYSVDLSGYALNSAVENLKSQIESRGSLTIRKGNGSFTMGSSRGPTRITLKYDWFTQTPLVFVGAYDTDGSAVSCAVESVSNSSASVAFGGIARGTVAYYWYAFSL
nr:MAG TPA: hypothetical protein [Caudoviricetes sp.]